MIGAHLLYDLAKKDVRIRALRRRKSNVDEVKKIFSYYSKNHEALFSKIEWSEGDLLDILSLEDAMKDVTHVYHCGAIVSMNPKHGKHMINNNVTGTANMVNISLEKKIHKFCYVSSVAALGIENGKDITEETTWNEKTNFSAYAISKYLSENEVWRATQEGLNAFIVNPTIVIGPGNWRRSSGVIFKTAMRGIRWYTSGGMGYVDVRDVVKAMVQLMESEISAEKFILSAENRSFKNFTSLVHASLGKPLPNKKAGKLILEIIWRIDKLRSILTGSSHILTKEIARYATIKLAYSNQKIKKATGMDFIPINQSVSDTSKHFLSDYRAMKK